MPEPHDSDDPAANNEDADSLSNAPETISLAWPAAGRNRVAIPRTIGNVKIGEEIGRGGMGVVHHGWDTVLHRTVAVKFLLAISTQEDNPQFDRFFGGARAEAAVKHPSIVSVYDAGQVKGVPYLILEYIDGPSLRAIMQPNTPPPLAVAVSVLWDVAEAVQVLHQQDIVHCDLKPGNVLFDRDGHLLVTDFGLASLRKRSDSGGPAVGTPAYMAPEMFEGKTSPQSDVYAMGIMLFELLAGRLPFTGDLQALRDAHCETPLPVELLPNTTPAPLIEMIERATHKKEVFRYKRAEHFQRALRDSVAVDDLLASGATQLSALVARCGTEPKETKPPESGSSSSNAYFEKLRTVAAGKRKERPRPTDAPHGVPEPISSTMSRHFRRLSRFIPEVALFETDGQRKAAMRRASSITARGSGRLWIWFLLFLMTVGGIPFLNWVSGLDVVWSQLESEYPIVRLVYGPLMMLLLSTWLWFCRSVIRRRLREQLVVKGVPICVPCGYDLHGQVDPRCPECGTAFDEKLLNPSCISTEETPTSTYFARLSEIAKEKRTQGINRPEEKAKTSADEGRVEDKPVVSSDLLCIGCGYNLRGLTVEGRCPECGTPVQRSRQGDLLAVSDPAWVARIARGEKLIYAAFQTALVNVALLFAGGTIILFIPPTAPGQGSIALLLLGVVYPGIQILAALLLVWGIFGVTTLDPRLALTEQPRVLRRFVRWAALACVSAIVASWLAVPLFRALGMGSSLPDTQLGLLFLKLPTDAHMLLRATRPVLVWSFVVGFMCALIGAFYYLARLAVRIPNPTLAVRTRSRAKGFAWLAGLIVLTRIMSILFEAVATVATVSTGVLAFLMVGYIMSFARVLATYRKEFTLCLQQARGVAVEYDAGAVEEDRVSTSSEPPRSVTVANRQSESSNPRDVLKLSRCPQCEYELTGLPSKHRCPECGFEYDESMFVLYGWLQSGERPSAIPLIHGSSIFARVTGVGILAFIAYMIYPMIRNRDWQPVIFVGFSLLFGIAWWMWRRRILRQRGGASQFAFSSMGAGGRRGPGRPDFIPWKKFRTFRFRRVGRDRWRLHLTSGFWHLRIRSGSSRGLFGGAVVGGIIECSRREAALIRSEIHRRHNLALQDDNAHD